MSTQDENLDKLAALLGDQQITDEEGEIGDETPSGDTAHAEETAENATDITAEKPEDQQEPDSKSENVESENDDESELAVDDSGKQYVPRSRFDKIYGKMKNYERELRTKPVPTLQTPQTPVVPSVPLPREDALEIEVLKSTMPQFDPSSDQYNPVLDELGSKEYEASKVLDKKGNLVPSITRIEAARRALDVNRRLGRKYETEISAARQAKADYSDSGITTRVTSRMKTNNVPTADASPEELEAYLKATGEWNKF